MATLIGRDVFIANSGRLITAKVISVDYQKTPVIATLVYKDKRFAVNASCLRLTLDDAIRACEFNAEYWQTAADRLREKLDEFVDIGKPEKPGNSHAN